MDPSRPIPPSAEWRFYDAVMTAPAPTTREAQPMYVRLPVELHEAVKERAQQDERTMAQTIRVALRFYLQKTTPVTT